MSLAQIFAFFNKWKNYTYTNNCSKPAILLSEFLYGLLSVNTWFVCIFYIAVNSRPHKNFFGGKGLGVEELKES